MLEKYPTEVKLVFKNLPLDFHKIAKGAATAALASHDQGKFWEFQGKLFANISALSDNKISEIARELKLDMDRFNRKMQDPAIQEIISRDMAEAKEIGVNGTPSVYINGKLLKDRSLAGFQGMIRAELESQKMR